MKKEINPTELDFLLRFPYKAGLGSPVDFLANQGWGGIKVGTAQTHTHTHSTLSEERVRLEYSIVNRGTKISTFP